MVLTVIKVKKADQPKVLSNYKIDLVVEKCMQTKGDIYDKASLFAQRNYPRASL